MSPDDGPFVNAAAICRDVIRDDAGGVSLLRMFDQLKVQTEEGVRFQLNFHLFVSMRAGKKIGPLAITMHLLYPSGEVGHEIRHDVVLSEEGAGVNLDVKVAIGTKEIGLYWFVIVADGNQVARVPLTVLRQPK